MNGCGSVHNVWESGPTCTSMHAEMHVDILNPRLGVLKDLYDLLQNGLNVKHGNKLEIIIIVLILVEVSLELLRVICDPLFVATCAGQSLRLGQSLL